MVSAPVAQRRAPTSRWEVGGSTPSWGPFINHSFNLEGLHMNEFETKAAADAKAAHDLNVATDAKTAADAKLAAANAEVTSPDQPVRRHQVHVAHVPTPTTEEAQKAVADAKEALDRETAKTVVDQNWQDVLDRAIGQGHPITSSIDQQMVNEEADKAATETAKHAKVAAHQKALADQRAAGHPPDPETRRQRGIDEAKARTDEAKVRADADAKLKAEADRHRP